jgi:hypothetical protein
MEQIHGAERNMEQRYGVDAWNRSTGKQKHGARSRMEQKHGVDAWS